MHEVEQVLGSSVEKVIDVLQRRFFAVSMSLAGNTFLVAAY